MPNRKGHTFRASDAIVGIVGFVLMVLAFQRPVASMWSANSKELEKQRRTMADIRNLATAIESYGADYGSYPPAACPGGLYTTQVTTGNLDSSSWTLLTPTYIAQPPYQDGWGRPLFYRVDPFTGGNNYEIASTGRNGWPDTLNCGTTTSFNDDIVFSDGAFIQWPEGPQQ